MTIRLRSVSTSPVTLGLWVFVTSQWMVLIDYFHVKLHSGCSRGPGSATGIIVVLHFLYVGMYLCISVLGVGWMYRRHSEDV